MDGSHGGSWQKLPRQPARCFGRQVSEKQLRGGLRWPVHSVIKDLVKRNLFYKQDLLCKNGIEQVTILP